jgi:hypothetical protein
MDTAAIWFGVEKDEATASAFAFTAHGGRPPEHDPGTARHQLAAGTPADWKPG